MNSRIVVAFVSRILSMINLPRESVTATEIVAWWTSMPIYFSWLITALLSVGGGTNNHNLPQSGRLLYCVHWRFCINRTGKPANFRFADDTFQSRAGVRWRGSWLLTDGLE